MTRIKLHFPEHCNYVVNLPLRISDINYGGHVSNDAILRLAHEARLMFLQNLGYTELDIAGASLIMNDAAIQYKHEGKYPDIFTIEIAIDNISKVGFNMYYKLTSKTSSELIALVKTGMVCYNYEIKIVIPVPEEFRSKING